MNGQGFFGHPYQGLYVAVDGIGCCGKSKQVKLLEQRIKKQFPEVELTVTKEPGGTVKCDQIRTAIVSRSEEKLFPWAEVSLFAASRGQLIGALIEPSLKRGATVLSDRCIVSSLCYQGFGLELGWQNVLRANIHALNGVLPDIIIFPDINYETAMERLVARDGRDNVYDQNISDPQYFNRVREGYRFFAERLPQFVREIDGSLSAEAQAELVWEIVRPMVEENLEARREILRGKERVY